MMYMVVLLAYAGSVVLNFVLVLENRRLRALQTSDYEERMRISEELISAYNRQVELANALTSEYQKRY